jgi:tetratricopeptide (TPR) repeat protein
LHLACHSTGRLDRERVVRFVDLPHWSRRERQCRFCKRIGQTDAEPTGPGIAAGTAATVPRYSGFSPMQLRQWLVLAIVLGVAAPALAQNQRKEAEAYVDFGIVLAQKGVWTGAVERFERATELDPSYAAAWNNLGIGLEQQGRFDEARKAYEKALELDPGNTFYRSNYDLFREIYDRQNRRRDR